jgi:hypothetical protein
MTEDKFLPIELEEADLEKGVERWFREGLPPVVLPPVTFH